MKKKRLIKLSQAEYEAEEIALMKLFQKDEG